MSNVIKSFFAPLKAKINNISDSVKIGKFVIRKISEKEYDKYIGAKNIIYHEDGNIKGVLQPNANFHKPYLATEDRLRYAAVNYIIECEDNVYFHNNLEKLLLSFRLYKGGDIFAPFIFNFENTSVGFAYPLFIKEFQIYEIDVSELNNIAEIFGLIINKPNKKLDIAFERFNHAITRKTNIKSSFIDLVGILESLFLSDDRTEITFKFSLYISYLLTLMV